MCGIVPRRNNLQNAQTVVAVGNKSESAPRYHSDLYIVYFMHRIVGIENLIQPRSFWIFDIDDSQSTRACCDLYTMDTANPCSQGFQSGAPNDQKSGIIFFPGSAGLYKNGVLVGGLGVSGDGVDQDDFVTSAGTKGFEAPTAIRADQISINAVRLPYFKFPPNPTD